jgi:hypothetical protein
MEWVNIRQGAACVVDLSNTNIRAWNYTKMKPKTTKPWHSLHTEVEGHAFDPDPKNDFVCVVCGEPRALHHDSGFKPGDAAPIPIDEENDDE